MEFFSKLIIRVPSLPFSKLFLMNESHWNQIKTNTYFAKALFLANPIVYNEFTEWKNGKILTQKKEKRLLKTLSHYWLRMHSNPTPFGLFGKIMIGEWSDLDSVILNQTKYSVRLDMDVLHNLVRYFNDMPAIKRNVKFFPNNTLYKFSDKIRYNEVQVENNKISYKISEIEVDTYIESILKYSLKGRTISEICDFISDDNYSSEDFENLVLEMIDSNVLISELQINITGDDSLYHIKSLIESIYSETNTSVNKILEYIEQIEILLDEIKSNVESLEDFFQKLFDHIKTVYIDVNPKKLIQIDVLEEALESRININHQKDLLESIKILSHLAHTPVLKRLEKFKNKFLERYENAFLPLMEVLDSENGIGFGEFTYNEDNIFLDETTIESDYIQESNTIEASQFLIRKYIDCIRNNSQVINLLEDDLKEISSKEDYLGNTFQLIFSIEGSENNLISLITVGNSSAANLISRFSHTSKELQSVVKDILDYESEFLQGKAITAEIVHIPEGRVGNITFRATTRDFEIPIVTQSTLNKEQQIALSDLYVGIRQNRIVLLSKRLKKEIKPKLTNAHNYGKNTLPIYQFLSELSYQNTLPSLRIDEKGGLANIYKFFPRIQYKNIIISKAYWLLTNNDFKELQEKLDILNLELVNNFLTHWKIPSIVTYNDEDISENEMFVLWTNLDSVKSFLTTVKDWKKIVLKEYLFDEKNPIVKNQSGDSYNNQVITFIKNTKSRKNIFQPSQSFEFPHVKRTFQTGDEWIYFKIYCGRKFYNKLLVEAIIPLVENLQNDFLIDSFFFLPYQDSDFHLRLRFHCKDSHSTLAAISLITTSLNNFNKEDELYRIATDAYNRELERYGSNLIGIAESIFDMDSKFILENYNFYISNQYFVPFLAIYQIDKLLNSFDLEFQSKYDFISSRFSAYSQEYNIVNKNDLKTQVDQELGKVRMIIKSVLENDDFYFINNEATGVEDYINNMRKYQKKLKFFIQEDNYDFSKTSFPNNFLSSIIHMHCIRLFPHNPRQNELFVYGALNNYYKSIYYSKKL